MKKSDFQFSDPCLTGLEFKINHDFEKGNIEEISMTNTFNVNVLRSDTDNQAMVALIVEINKDVAESPFYLMAEIGSSFVWTENIKSELVEIFLNQNAPALLLAYVRPIVANITNNSPFPIYNLPFMNFTTVSNE